MARVYLMIEDLSTEDPQGEEQNVGVSWSVDWGLKEEEVLPEEVEEMSDAQYTVWQMIAVLRNMENSHDAQMVVKPESKLIVPHSAKVM